MTPSELKAALLRAFPDAEVDVTDLTGTQDHYRARIVADAFAGKSRLEQHRLVYGALGDVVGAAVHALALDTSSRPSKAP
jgi:stress-induced morphogen